MRKRSQRLWLIVTAAILAAGAVGLAAVALKDTVAFAYTPTQLIEKDVVKPGRALRVGGLVEKGSIEHKGADLVFRVTDGAHATEVTFQGTPPDLFAEGQGIVAVGKFDLNGKFVADKVLARHDETCIPKEAYESLRKAAGSEGAAEYKLENGK